MDQYESVLVIAVLGGGHGALAAAGDLAIRGFTVRLALRNRNRFAELFETGRVTLTGALEGTGELALVTDDHAAATRGADLVLVPLPAIAQVAMAERVAPAVHDGQLVALLPGNLGSQAMRRALPGAVFAETATLPYGARQRGPAAAGLALVAHHNPTGAFPSADTDAVIARLREVYHVTEPVENALSAALLNSNGALHAPLVLLSAAPIERLGEYDIHVEGTTPSVRRVIAALDEERIALRQALGYTSPHWPLMDYYADADWFYGRGAYSRVQRDSVWREKLDFGHRYVAEDVGCGLVLWSSLGRALGVPTPLADACIQLASVLTGVDYRATGRTLESLGLARNDLRRL
ncbi:MAG TPA: NAD/NADP octopine/nopaline dehydrogenase family protein [Candidatus Dormibacteraeota bacterium]|nr:NAD/NADP octopine/nopaline dehydrogenase family protein [Candidatus Dormibacteraeota bacterium]